MNGKHHGSGVSTSESKSYFVDSTLCINSHTGRNSSQKRTRYQSLHWQYQKIDQDAVQPQDAALWISDVTLFSSADNNSCHHYRKQRKLAWYCIVPTWWIFVYPLSIICKAASKTTLLNMFVIKGKRKKQK